MKIALVQTHISWENKAENISKLEKIITDDHDADVFFLPEMSFTGFSMNTGKTADRDRETVTAVQEIASRNNAAVGFGWVRPSGGKCENMYTVVSGSGEVISEYAKIHPFSYSGEDRFFTGGNRISVFDIGGIPFTAFICYDLRFPELFRRVCGNVQAVVIPANWPAERSGHWKTLLRARAIENQVYIFAVNCVGDMNGLYYSGDSCVITPNGDMDACLSDEEGVIRYDLTDDAGRYRKSFPVLNDRKSALFYEHLKIEQYGEPRNRDVSGSGEK